MDDMQNSRYFIADKGYDAASFRKTLRGFGACPVITGRSNGKRLIIYDKERYRERRLVSNAFCRLKDFRRIATRYDKLGQKLPFDSSASDSRSFLDLRKCC
jgi:transposase